MRVSLGIVRKIDELGRVVIPKEVLKSLGIEWSQQVSSRIKGEEIFVSADKNKGLVRKLDTLGRLVIAKELRKKLNLIDGETSIEFFRDGEDIIMRKYEAGCTFCGNLDIEKVHQGKNVCSYCLGVLRG